MPHNERHKLIPSVYLILEHDGKVLLSRRCHTGWQDGNYGIGAAGHAEEGETFRAAMAREAKEEIGIDIDLDDLTLALTVHRNCGDHQRVDFFFTASTYTGEPIIAEPDKCDDLQWFAFDQLPENTIDHVAHALQCYRKGITYAEFDWSTV